ncbi:MAG: ATP-binding protein [Gammaproteobacteria bacterium]
MPSAITTNESVAPAASTTSAELIAPTETETTALKATEPTPLFSAEPVGAEPVGAEPAGAEPAGLEAVQSGIATLLDILAPALEDNSPATLNLILRRFAEQLHKISDNAVAAGMLGFYDLSLLFAEQLNQISEREDDCSQDELALLEEWPTLAMCYLDAPSDPANAQALIEHMTSSAWRAPMQAEEAAMLLDMLQQSAISADTLAFDDGDITPAGDPLATDSEAGLWAGASAAEDLDNIPLWDNSPDNETTGTETLSAADKPDVPPETTVPLAAEPALFVADEATEQPALDAEISVSDETPDLLAVPSDESSSIAFSDAAEIGIGEEPEQLTPELHSKLHPALHPGLNADDYPADNLDSEAAIAPDSDMPSDFDLSEESVTTDLDLSEEPSVTTDLDLSDDEAPASISEDLLEILRVELAEIAEAGEQSLSVVQNPASNAEQRQQALESYTEELERLSLAADSIGLQGLAQLCAHLHANLDAFTAREQVLSDQESALLRGWQQPVLGYLEAIGTEASSRQLVDFMTQAEWLLPLDQDTANDILESLRHPAPSLEDFGEVEERPREARPEDVSLELPPETNPELLDSLLQELPNQTSEFSAAIQQLYEGTGTQADMEAAQRIAHTLKGAGNTVGVTGIATITHHIEDILIALGKEHSLPTRKLSGVLMDAADCLESMCESLLGLSDPPAQSQAVLQTILDLANRIDREGVPSIMADDSVTSPVREKSTPVTPTVADITPSQTPAPVLTQQPAQPVQQAAAANTAQREDSTATAMVRVPATLIDELLRLVGESIILTGQVQERIRANMAQATLVREQNKTLQQLVNELEQLVDVQGVGLPSMAVRQDGHFDPLEMDQYNELHTVTRRLVEAAADAQALDEGINDNFTELDTLMSDQTQVHRDTQETVMRTRMVTIQTVVPRLQRAVRQTGRLTDKEVELTVKGGNTLIDSNVLSDIIDPLMHILRNAIDHGIEPPEVRKAHNKPGNGHITLSFQREGNSIVVRCQDDGKGLDLDGIRHTAEQRGLLLPGQSMSEEELTRLILQPGFSTRTQATQVSGRGIGMDVVYSEVLQLKGSLAIRSDPGKGCTIEMRLPVTLISTHALMVRCGDDIFAVAERGIEQLVHATTGEVMNISDRLVYKLNEQLYDVLQLSLCCTCRSMASQKNSCNARRCWYAMKPGRSKL